MDLRVEASTVGSVLADALSPRHIGAERFRVVVKAVDEGREQRRLLQRRGRVCQCESNRAGGREHRLLSSSATNQVKFGLTATFLELTAARPSGRRRLRSIRACFREGKEISVWKFSWPRGENFCCVFSFSGYYRLRSS